MKQIIPAIQLSRLPGVGAAKFRELLATHKLPSIALQAFLQETHDLSSQSVNKASVSELVANTIHKIQNKKIEGYYFSHPDYPIQLSDLTEPPPVLFSSSKLNITKYAAVVGARAMTVEANSITKKVVKALIADGYAIISGGAAGVDTCAHKAALKYGTRTIAILANGIDVVYPNTNKKLFDEIRCNGNIISEFLIGTKPRRSFFPTRNRIIAALADVVVVIQASAQSGSMITARWAKKLNRTLLTIKPPTNNLTAWAGNEQLNNSGIKFFDKF